MDELVTEFKSESQEIIEELLQLLEEMEEGLSPVSRLDDYGQKVDRIMGGATSLAVMMNEDHLLTQIGSCAGLCKTLGYRGSQITANPALATAVVAVLADMTEILETMVEIYGTSKNFDLQNPSFLAMVGRLRWLIDQFADNTRSSLKIDSKEDHLATQFQDFLKKFSLQ